MKSLLVLLFLFYSISLFSQEINDNKNKITFTTQERDTLWILGNQTGKLIAESWKLPTLPKNEKIPVIIMVKSLPPDKDNK
jgi:hypothetical protein